jgi:Domain of unknown function (DUF5916)
VLGAIGSSVARRLDIDALRQRLDSHAEMLGADLRFTWNEHMYSLIGSAAVSNIGGDSLAILRAQRSSARYFQRSDRESGSNGIFSEKLDSSATGLRGAGAYLRLGKDAGNWLWETAINTRTPGYEVNDIAFQQRADYIWHNANIFRYWSKPTKWYRDFNVILGAQEQFNYGGDNTDRDVHAWVGGTMPNFWSWSTFAIRRPSVFDDRLLRGGPLVKLPGTGFIAASLFTDSRSSVRLSANPSYSWNDAGGWGVNANLNARWRVASNVNITLGPSVNSSKSILQFVTSVADPTATAFAGRRYVLSNLAQRQLVMDTRVDATFTPTMTLSLYAQPFIASAHYSDFKQYDAPRSLRQSVFGRDKGTIAATRDASGTATLYTIDPDGPAAPAAPFTIGNPDFNLRSLRGNAVFRWEYRPGSTVFVVWTQQRTDQSVLGNFDLTRDREALFAAHPDNIFLVKVAYWLGR